MIDVSIIIVSFNTRDVLRNCLRSVQAYASPVTTEIIVIDNASKDGTHEMVRSEFGDVVLIANEDNRGFGAANNQGMAVASGRYFLLLNSDTELRTDLIGDLFQFAESRPDAGVVSCRFIGVDGMQQRALFRFPTLLDVLVNTAVPKRWTRGNRLLGRGNYAGESLDVVREVDIVGGCCMFVRRKAFVQTRGFDEAFFMYAEEFEWCYRIRKSGWKILYTPATWVLHYGGLSTQGASERMRLEMARSQVLLFDRISGRNTAFAANLVMALRDLPRAIVWVLCCPFAIAGRLRPDAKRFRLHAVGLFRPFWHLPAQYCELHSQP